MEGLYSLPSAKWAWTGFGSLDHPRGEGWLQGQVFSVGCCQAAPADVSSSSSAVGVLQLQLNCLSDKRPWVIM